MNINDLTKGMDPQKLNETMRQLGNIMSQEQINQVMGAINSTGKNELNQKMSQINKSDVNKVIENCPALQKALSSNPNAMKTLNSLFQQNKK